MANELTKEMIMNALSELRRRSNPLRFLDRDMWIIRLTPEHARQLVKIFEESPEDIPLLIEVVK